MPILAALTIWTTLFSPTQTSTWPQTRAERTRFTETSHYEDVVQFLNGLQEMGAPVTLSWMGTSVEGKPIPMVVASRPLVTTPTQAKSSGKPIVYIQANIHAGEVEGKEAALALLRKYCQEKSGLLDKLILVIVPIYNIDGNEKFGPLEKNRPGQEGPALVGVRPNGGGLDLNRDCMKAESPEMQGVLKHVYSWDPDVVMDLHTTDGTRHGYQLTYSPPLHPNTDPEVLKYSRDELLPTIRKSVATGGLRLFDYGNASRRDDKTIWETFGYEGRYVTNYAGLRNRIAVLSEAMTNEPFSRRVADTETFVDATLQQIARQARKVVEMTRRADERVVAWGTDPSKAPQLGVRFEMADRGEEPVLLETAARAKRIGPITDYEAVKMKVYDRFRATKRSRFPSAYLIPTDQQKVIDLLVLHGVKVEKLNKAWSGQGEKFQVSEAKMARSPFQGHRIISLEGTFSAGSLMAEKGWYVVRTAQPLGVLAFDLLEPESLDGVSAWGFLGDSIKAGEFFPIYKTYLPVKTATERV